jgi:hypothetical protein
MEESGFEKLGTITLRGSDWLVKGVGWGGEIDIVNVCVSR